MRVVWLNSLLALGVSLVASTPATAQPLFSHAESLESTVANADLVVIAKLVGFGGGGPAEGQEVTIDVEETLKQDLFTIELYRRMSVHVLRPASVLAEWKDHSCRLLVAVKVDGPASTTVIDLAHEGPEALSADFTLLRDPEVAIRIARETARRMPDPVRRIHTFGLVVPREAVARTKWQGVYETRGHLVLSVPVDERLEKRSLDSLRSESYQAREEGVRALRYFKSDGNLARVKPLLNDPGWAYRRHARENDGIEVRFYGVREEAYRTLKAWGVEVNEPKILEEVRR